MYNNGCPEPEHAELERKVELLEAALAQIRDTFMKALEGGVLAIDYVVGGKMKDIATNALLDAKKA